MAILNQKQKLFIVERSACFDTPLQIAKEFEEEFGFKIIRQHCQNYDPTKKAGKFMAKALVEHFWKTREEFKKNVESIPIANKAVRLKTLQRMVDAAEGRKNLGQVAELLEQAAKEVGDAYTNHKKVDVTSSDGSMTPNRGRSLDEFYKDVDAADVQAKPGA